MPRIARISSNWFYCVCDEGLPRIHEFPRIDFIMACDEGLPRIAQISCYCVSIKAYHKLHKFPQIDFITVCDERLATNSRIPANWFYYGLRWKVCHEWHEFLRMILLWLWWKVYHKLHKFSQIDFIMACDEGLPRVHELILIYCDKVKVKLQEFAND